MSNFDFHGVKSQEWGTRHSMESMLPKGKEKYIGLFFLMSLTKMSINGVCTHLLSHEANTIQTKLHEDIY